jgi:hypothetical protein
LVLELAQTVLELLQLVSSRALPAKRNAVYVSLTAPDLESIRSKIVDELTALEIPVLPTENYVPIDTPGVSAAIDSCLNECRLSVHFSGALRGPIPEGEDLSITALQYEMAAKASLPRVVWLQPGTEIGKDFRSCLQKIGLEGAEILDMPNLTVEDLKRAVKSRIQVLERTTSSHLDPDRKVSVYFLCDGADYPVTTASGDKTISDQVVKYLSDKGYTVWLPPLNIKEEQLREDDHKETLEISDAVLLLWGASSEQWFRKRLRELATIETWRSHRPLLGRALLLSKPPVGKSQYRNHLDLVIEQFEEFQPQMMEPLDDLIRRRRSG